MAYDIIGQIHSIGQTEQITTSNGNPFQKRTVTVMQPRYDRNTGQPYDPNYVSFEFVQKGCALLDQFQPRQQVKISFDISGRMYTSKKTGKEECFNSLRGFRIERYAPPTQQGSYPPQNGYQQPPQGYIQGGYQQQGYAPQGQYQQQGYQQPAPPQNNYAPPGPQGENKDDLPF